MSDNTEQTETPKTRSKNDEKLIFPYIERFSKETEGRSDEIQLQKAIALALEKNTVQLTEVELNRENWNKFFPNGSVETPIGTVKLGKNQFNKLQKEDRNNLLAAMYETLSNPSIVLEKETLDKNSGNFKPVNVYGKSFVREDSNHKRIVESVVIFKDGDEISIGTHNKDIGRFTKQIKTADQIIFADSEISRVASLILENGESHVQLKGINTQALNPHYNKNNLVSIKNLNLSNADIATEIKTPKTRSEYLQGKKELSDVDIINILDLPVEKINENNIQVYTQKSFVEIKNNSIELETLAENLKTNGEYLKYRSTFIAKSKLLYQESSVLCNEIPCMMILDEINEPAYLLPYGYSRENKEDKAFADALKEKNNAFTEFKRVFSEDFSRAYKNAKSQGNEIFICLNDKKSNKPETFRRLKKIVNASHSKNKNCSIAFYAEKEKLYFCYNIDKNGIITEKNINQVKKSGLTPLGKPSFAETIPNKINIPSTTQIVNPNFHFVNDFYFESLLARGAATEFARNSKIKNRDIRYLQSLSYLESITKNAPEEILEKSNKIFIQAQKETKFYQALIAEQAENKPDLKEKNTMNEFQSKNQNTAANNQNPSDTDIPHENRPALKEKNTMETQNINSQALVIDKNQMARMRAAREIKENMPNLSENERAAAVAILEAGAKSQKTSISEYMEKTFPNGIFGDIRTAEAAARQQGVEINGAVSINGFGENAKTVIYAGKTADFSTWCHELSHVWQSQLTGELKQNAEEAFQVKNSDWQKSIYIFEDGHTDTSAEAFAYGFEDFLKHKAGEMATVDKKAIFEKFADYMSRTYNGVKLHIKINEKITSVYQKLIELDDNILAQAEKAVRLEIEQEQKINEIFNSPNFKTSQKVSETIGLVSDKFAALASQYGYDIKGYSHTIDNFFVNHALKQHGDKEAEEKRGNVAITYSDICNVFSVYTHPDYIVFGTKTKTGNPAIVYVKNIGDSTIFVEDVRNGKKELAAQTLYKKFGTIDVSSKKEAPELYAHSDPESISIVDVKKEFVNESKNEFLQPVNSSMLFQSAYHGSSANFDKFNTSEYGLSGDGAMAFGYGVYVSNSETIARSYAGIQGERNLYAVEIPDSGYIVWDKTVSKSQKEKVKSELYENLIKEDYKGVEKQISTELDNVFSEDFDGKNLYGTVSSYIGSDRETSIFFKNIGYAGIQYPAGSSENASNYVIFDDNDIKIKNHFQFQTIGKLEAREFDRNQQNKLTTQMILDQEDREQMENISATIKSAANAVLDENGNEIMFDEPKSETEERKSIKAIDVWNEINETIAENPEYEYQKFAALDYLYNKGTDDAAGYKNSFERNLNKLKEISKSDKQLQQILEKYKDCKIDFDDQALAVKIAGRRNNNFNKAKQDLLDFVENKKYLRELEISQKQEFSLFDKELYLFNNRQLEENPSVQMEPRLMKKFDEMKKAIENREKQEGQTAAEKTESAGSKKEESHEKPKVDLIKKAAKDFISAIKNGTAPFLNTTENDFGKILLHPAAIVNASNGLPFSGEAQLLAQIYHQQQKMEGEIVTTFEGAKESGTFIADKPESKKNFVLANKTEQQQKEIIQKTRYFMPEACSEPDKIYAHALQMQRPQKISDYRDLIRHFENIPNGQKEISDLRIRIAHEHLKEIQSRFALKEKRILTVDEINERKKILQDYFKSLPEKHRESEKSAFENTFGLTLNPEEVFKTNLEGNFKDKKFEDVVKSNEKLTDQANRRLSAFIQNNSMEDKKLSEILHEEYNEQLKEEKSTSKKLKIEAKGITEPETYLGKYLAACSSNAEFVTDEDTIKAVQANLVKKLEENYRLEKYGILKEIGQQAQKISNETTSKIAFDKAHSNKNVKEKNIAKEIGPVGMGN